MIHFFVTLYFEHVKKIESLSCHWWHFSIDVAKKNWERNSIYAWQATVIPSQLKQNIHTMYLGKKTLNKWMKPCSCNKKMKYCTCGLWILLAQQQPSAAGIAIEDQTGYLLQVEWKMSSKHTGNAKRTFEVEKLARKQGRLEDCNWRLLDCLVFNSLVLLVDSKLNNFVVIYTLPCLYNCKEVKIKALE